MRQGSSPLKRYNSGGLTVLTTLPGSSAAKRPTRVGHQGKQAADLQNLAQLKPPTNAASSSCRMSGRARVRQ
eukprot:CAMPEP_0204175264 /NCGR_PEP_ID=MMETSP0361-20130328/46596_1 /ASSEMBLY_ACC=CAM_ASM_000343 /TAXON_ID=268821 /ORGANISM="Scrippsiella Hangoei, Strain SHTV-5" /LENGTH=71 /DNA_ID=CAMNT_0051133887 /DNA_START=252 /DNA_END=464 /DNA_ORIENTATION=-